MNYWQVTAGAATAIQHLPSLPVRLEARAGGANPSLWTLKPGAGYSVSLWMLGVKVTEKDAGQLLLILYTLGVKSQHIRAS